MNQINPDLLKPFKSEEKYRHTTSDGKELTHLKARVIENRLNDVLGLDWSHKIVPAADGKPYQIMEYDDGIDMIVIVELTIQDVGPRQGIGTVRIDETSGIIWADYAKMAENNAIFKAANKFGIGNDLYGAPQSSTSNSDSPRVKNVDDPASERQIATLRKMVNWKLNDTVRTSLTELITKLDTNQPVTKGEASSVMDANQASKK